MIVCSYVYAIVSYIETFCIEFLYFVYKKNKETKKQTNIVSAYLLKRYKWDYESKKIPIGGLVKFRYWGEKAIAGITWNFFNMLYRLWGCGDFWSFPIQSFHT